MQFCFLSIALRDYSQWEEICHVALARPCIKTGPGFVQLRFILLLNDLCKAIHSKYI